MILFTAANPQKNFSLIQTNSHSCGVGDFHQCHQSATTL